MTMKSMTCVFVLLLSTTACSFFVLATPVGPEGQREDRGKRLMSSRMPDVDSYGCNLSDANTGHHSFSTSHPQHQMWTQPDQDSHFQAGLNTLEREDYLPLAQSLPSQAEVKEARAVLRKLKARDAVAKRDNQRRQDRLESGEQLKIGKGRLRTTPISEAHAKTLENRRIIYNERVKPKKEKLAQQKQADWLRQVEHAQNIVARYERCEAAARQEGMPPPSSYLQEMDFFPQQVMEHTSHSSSSWVAPSTQPTTLSPSELRPYSPQTFQFTLDGEQIEP